jgi:4'-phosphopantetheinyl transferase
MTDALMDRDAGRAIGRRPAAGEIHVWRVDLMLPPAALDRFEGLLSTDERARANRFHFDRDRRRYIAARGALRTILAPYAGIAPGDVRFEYAAHGKPELSGPEPLSFNVSHSGELALVAVAGAGAIGVDLEAIRELDDRDGIAARFFSAVECASLRALPESMRTRAFFACWTRKEAFVKAIGEGLSHPLDTFDVTFAPDAEPRLRIAGQPAESARWSVTALDAGSAFEAALVTEGPRAVAWRTFSTEQV